MKIRSYFLSATCLLAVALSFTACSDDDDDAEPATIWSSDDLGSAVEMSQTRGFVLNEGSYGYNNAHLTYFDYATDEPLADDIFETQNGIKIGDTAQDLVVYDGNLYLVVNGSNYLAKLNGVGVEQARFSFADYSDLGEARYAAAADGYIYVTSYGGYVSRFDAEALEYLGSQAVGSNPEQIIVEDGKIYCVNSGWGYDNRLSIIDATTFGAAENVEIMTNPQRILSANGTIVIQGYGGAYGAYTYPVEIYDPATQTSTQIGTGTGIAAYGSTVYIVNTEVDYSTYPDQYKGTTAVTTYDVTTGVTTASPLDLPAAVTGACSYGLSVNELTGDVYVCITNYTWGDGEVYHFASDGSLTGSFSSYGQNPNKVVFVNE